MSTIGFAIKQNDSINVKTVSPTEQAAKINWLLVECFLPVRNDATGAQIEQAWRYYSSNRNAICIQVEIREMAP